MTINFYRTGDEYGCFSNFSRHPVKYRGHVYPTSEHAYQAMKFEGTKHQFEIQLAKTPMEAANMGRERFRPLRSDWESVKYQIMKDIVTNKVSQHDEVKQALLSTGNEKLVEHTENDNVWADGGDGSGQNLLGKILMEVRNSLQNGQL